MNKLEEAFTDAKNDQKFIMSDSDRVGNVLLGLHQGATGIRYWHFKSSLYVGVYGSLITTTIVQDCCSG